MESKNPTNLVLETGKRKKSFFTKQLSRRSNSYYRNFIWRQPDATIYVMIVSEILLQKTTSKQVANFMPLFINQYPSFEDLAESDIQTVEKALFKLGLYKRRALTLKVLAAKVKSEKPSSPEEWENLLKKIPGVGDYSRNAFLINCFNSKRIAIDTNIRRLINRYFGIAGNKDLRRDKLLQVAVKDLFPNNNRRDFFFSLLDYSSEICKPDKPGCKSCVLKSYCSFKR